MHFVKITPDDGPEDLAEAALHLMRRETTEPDPALRAFLGEDVDELVSMLRHPR